MAKRTCPDCGAEHECGAPDGAYLGGAEVSFKTRGGKGYSLYYAPCRCGCGCGHTCDLIYGPYAKVYNARGAEAMKGPLGAELRQMRAASAEVRRDHLAAVHHLTTGR